MTHQADVLLQRLRKWGVSKEAGSFATLMLEAADLIEALTSPSVIGSDTAGLPSDHAGLVERYKREIILAMQLQDFGRRNDRGAFITSPAKVGLLEACAQQAALAIAALSRATEASGWQVQDHDGVWKNAPSMTAAYGARSDGTVRAVRATPPAPQPALSEQGEAAQPAAGDVKALLQRVGDSIADVFEQMLKGQWRDDHGHAVRLNTKMVALAASLRAIGAFRAEHLDYTPFASPGIASQAEEGSE